MDFKRWVAGVLAAAVVGIGFGTAVAAGAAGSQDDQARYDAGAAKFAAGDLAGAGRALVQFAPFAGEYGGRARYLLGRIHQLNQQRPEAEADYQAVQDWWAKNKTGEKTPDYVQRAAFYEGAMIGEDGKCADAIARLKPFEDAKSAIGTQAILRVGLLQLQDKQYSAAVATLQPLLDHPEFADQALWFSARAVLAAAPAKDAVKWPADMKHGMDLLRQAAEKARNLGASSSEARVRFLDETLELGDAQMAMKDFAGAAKTYQTVAENSLRDPAWANLPSGGEEKTRIAARLEEGSARQIAALELAGDYQKCQTLAGQFHKQWPASLLTGGVLFHQAQSIYLQAMASAAKSGTLDPQAKGLLETACERFADVVSAYPEDESINQARLGWGSALYRMDRYAEAANVLHGIPSSDRSGNLATVGLMAGDCLLRTLPPDGDDALSTAKMLRHAEQAAAQFSEFAQANPQNPLAAQANFKLGYCYERMAGVLVDGTTGERWKTWKLAKDAYDKVCAQAPADSPLLAQAVLQRAKAMIGLGDQSGAIGELRRFQSQPLAKAADAPLAILRLAMLLRLQGNGAEGAEILAKWRQAEKSTGDKASAASSPASPALGVLTLTSDGQGTSQPYESEIAYEQGVCLKDSGKIPEARAIFTEVAKADAGSAAGIDSLWRIAQCDREALTQQFTETRRRLTAARSQTEKDAAEKAFTAAIDNIRQWTQATRKPAAEALAKGGCEGAARWTYELAWGYEMLGDAGVPVAYASATGSHAQLTSAQIQAVDAFRAVIAAGDRPGAGPEEQDAAKAARIDLGELLGRLGHVDEALELFTEVLEQGVEPWEAVKPHLRIAECLLAKGDPEGAQSQVNMTLRASGGRIAGEGRYIMGEACMQMKQPQAALEMLRSFEDNRFNAGEVRDRALVSLADLLLARGKHAEAADLLNYVVKRFAGSPVAPEAREKLMLCQLARW